ncbi:hypothetical protein VTH06DRAFT_3588 [Thermothelomyces fergusii]
MGSVMLPHLPSGWHVDQAILSEEERVVVIRFGRDHDPLANPLRPKPSGFNFFGLSVTRSVSATARSTIDTCRTLFIWMVSLGLGWETFKWLQVVGFALLVYSTFLFNGVVQPPFAFLRVREVEELLPEEPIEHN